MHGQLGTVLTSQPTMTADPFQYYYKQKYDHNLQVDQTVYE